MSDAMSNGRILLLAIALGFLGGFSVVTVTHQGGSGPVSAYTSAD